MQQPESVAIFWDFGNCPVPSNVSGREVVRNLMSLAHSFGSVKQFKAYWDMSQSNSPLAFPTLRSQLQSSGVSLTDCPPNSGNDAAGRMLLVDMIAYAIDNSPPATIILITSEQDCSYAVSILRLRKYRVVVIAPPGTMVAQASVHLDWNSEVLHAPGEELNQPKPPKPGSRQRADSIPSTPSTSRTQYVTDADNVVDIYGAYDKYQRGLTSYSTRINGIGVPFTSQQYSKPLSGRQTPVLNPPEQGKSSTFQSNPASPPIAYKTSEPVFVTEGNGLFESSTPTPNLPKGFPYSEPEPRAGPIQPSFSITESSSSSSSIFQPAPIQPTDAASKAYEPVKTPPPAIQPVPRSAPNPSEPAMKPAPPVTPLVPPAKPVLGTSALASSSASKEVHGPNPQATYLKANQASSNNIKSLPAYFVVLAQKLQARREAIGQPRIPRTDIGSELAKSKSVYAQAGVSKFATFISMAQSAGVVDVGGSGDDQWVSLRPEWHGAASLS